MRLFCFITTVFSCAFCKTKVEWEEPMKGLRRLHLHYIHSRCWLDFVEPGPVALGAGFSCLFLQVWCLMLIPPHVPWALSKHAGLVTAPVGPPFLLPAVFSLSASPGGPPTHTATASHQSSPPYLSAELQPWKIVRYKPKKPPFFTFFTFMVGTCLMSGYVHTAALLALLEARGQAQVTQSC